jgi:hypothetical protein
MGVKAGTVGTAGPLEKQNPATHAEPMKIPENSGLKHQAP